MSLGNLTATSGVVHSESNKGIANSPSLQSPQDLVLPTEFRTQVIDRINELFEHRKQHFLDTHSTSDAWIYMYRYSNQNDRTIVTNELNTRAELVKKNVLNQLEKIVVVLQKTEPNIQKIIEILNAKTTIDKYDETQSSLCEGMIHFYCHLESHEITGMLRSEKYFHKWHNTEAHWNKIRDILHGTLPGSTKFPSTVHHAKHYCDILCSRSEKELQRIGKESDREYRTLTIP